MTTPSAGVTRIASDLAPVAPHPPARDPRWSDAPPERPDRLLGRRPRRGRRSPPTCSRTSTASCCGSPGPATSAARWSTARSSATTSGTAASGTSTCRRRATRSRPGSRPAAAALALRDRRLGGPDRARRGRRDHRRVARRRPGGPGRPGGPSMSAVITLPDAPADLADALGRGAAVAWSEPLTIRTYEAGEPSPYPMYLDHRVYQGSSGKVYPLPFVDHVDDEGRDRPWQAIHLENAYVRLVVLPELGGRIHVGYDKTTGYDFFYRNNVIKPALVGLGGPWISGGVELNWPQHHRPATYLPVETRDRARRRRVGDRLVPRPRPVRADVGAARRAAPGGQLRRRARGPAAQPHQRAAVVPVVGQRRGARARRLPVVLRPGRALRRRPRPPRPHGLPRADRPYYGVDYPARAEQEPGADRIDWYRNIPVPTSYMIVDSHQDFFGGYDHAAGAGFVHWAERRLSPGKKQWTWGDAPSATPGTPSSPTATARTSSSWPASTRTTSPTSAGSCPARPRSSRSTGTRSPPSASPTRRRRTPPCTSSTTGAVVAHVAVTSPRPGAELRVLRDGVVVAARTVDLVPGVPADDHRRRPPPGCSASSSSTAPAAASCAGPRRRRATRSRGSPTSRLRPRPSSRSRSCTSRGCTWPSTGTRRAPRCRTGGRRCAATPGTSAPTSPWPTATTARAGTSVRSTGSRSRCGA